jgi:glutathione S-transferase
MVTFEWIGEAYALCRVSKEARAGDAYKARVNARAQVPALAIPIAGATRTIVEVNAILAYLADAHPELALLPPNGSPERDVANQWLAYLGSGFHPPFWPYFSPQKYTTNPEHEASVKEAAVIAIRRELAFVDAHLRDREYVLGGARTVLDAYVQAMDRWAGPIVDMSHEYPNVWRHQKLVTQMPAVRIATSLERGEILATSGACVRHEAFA